MNFVTQFFDFFLPRICPSCKNKLNPFEKFICSHCLGEIKYAGIKRIKSEYESKFLSEGIISDFCSLYIFEKDKELQNIIHSIKYNENFRLGINLGKIVGSELNEVILEWAADLLIPIPLHHLKKAERGYNQSYFIAKGISTICKIPVNHKVIKRNRFTPSQTALKLQERKENVRDAFSIKKQDQIKGKKIIIVDDVITTGSTITECGRKLLEAGAEKIYALSPAVADR